MPGRTESISAFSRSFHRRVRWLRALTASVDERIYGTSPLYVPQDKERAKLQEQESEIGAVGEEQEQLDRMAVPEVLKAESHWEEEAADLEYYESRFRLTGAQKRRLRKPPKNERHRFELHRAEVEALAEVAGLENVWETTYTPARFEGVFLKESLLPFFAQDQIVDVMAQVKGGKEASVYLCKAHPSMAMEWIAAKVYRPRQFRNLTNDAIYREGRQLLTSEEGRPQAINPRDERIAKAVGKKSAFGVQVRHMSWLLHEFSTLQILHEAGVPVPAPYSVGENAILMEYIGDVQVAAPTLQEVRLEEAEVQPLYELSIQSIKAMLQRGLVHGDLSAFNILYWQGEIKLIDFPQVVDTESNRSARSILGRDVERVCQYFQRYGVQVDPRQLADDLWERYAALDPDDWAADFSRLELASGRQSLNDEEAWIQE